MGFVQAKSKGDAELVHELCPDFFAVCENQIMGCRKGFSDKAVSVQTEVLARRFLGQSKSKIAREMNIDRETVTRVEKGHHPPQVEAWKCRMAAAAVKAVQAQLRDRKAPGDGNLGLRVLEGAGVLHRKRGWRLGIRAFRRAQARGTAWTTQR
jgi:DNA-binding XRE family transcriptional regulator